MTTNSPIAELRSLLIGHDRALLPPIDLTVTRGEYLGIVGPNGGGKSTLVKTLCGVIRPLGGEIRFPAGRPRMAYVPQRDSLDPAFPLSAREVVELALVGELSLLERLGPNRRTRASEALAGIGMAIHADRLYRDLSGGQKQRVLLARALATNPEFLILDEPTAGLDLPSTDSIFKSLDQLSRANTTLIVVSHDLASLAGRVTRVALVDHGHAEFLLSEDASEAALRARIYAANGENGHA